ncbi:hypothetical protein [Streptomyces sp. NRRL S-350]|uniref:hypothetical protein n=1 Tax=Streptomyces sp. NRRL S-350 TaxID=1463902 RepID=UPI00069089D3|nr:hypothetical protein [Streptomyces sp. NRRL S-350]
MARAKTAAAPRRPDLVVPVRVGAAPELLRYAARSWAAHLPHDSLFVAGRWPGWLANAVFLDADPDAGTAGVLRAAVEDSAISDPFLFAGPGTVTLTPLGGDVPVMHGGPARDVEDQAETVARLAELGHPDPVVYENGLLLVDKAGALAALDAAQGLARPYVRTLYGNLAGLGGEPAGKAVVEYRGPRFPLDAPVLSVGTDAFRHGYVGAFLREAFPTPSPYELEV